MSVVEIYTWKDCPYCLRAKEILERHHVQYHEFCIDGDDEARRLMTARAGGHSSVPQIFLDNEHLGGCAHLTELEEANQVEATFDIARDQE